MPLELLQYALYLKTSPTGEAIPGNCKLLLMILIMEGGGEEFVIDPPGLTAKAGLTHIKSLSRVLKDLRNLELITTTQARGKGGLWGVSTVYPLPKFKRRRGNNIGRGNNIEPLPGNNTVTPSDPGNNIVTPLSVGARKDLELPGNNIVTPVRGTVIAFISPSLLLHNTKEKSKEGELDLSVKRLLDHPAVRVWLEVMQENISIDTATFISNRVTILPAWREVLEGWKATPNWNNQNIAGQVERYQKAAKTYEAPPEKARVKDPIEEARIKRIMYGNE